MQKRATLARLAAVAIVAIAAILSPKLDGPQVGAVFSGGWRCFVSFEALRVGADAVSRLYETPEGDRPTLTALNITVTLSLEVQVACQTVDTLSFWVGTGLRVSHLPEKAKKVGLIMEVVK